MNSRENPGPAVVIANVDTTILSTFLSKSHLQKQSVVQVTSLSDLLGVVNKENVDVAIVDTNISPDLNKTVIAMLRKINRHLKVIITSSRQEPAFKLEMWASGITYYGVNPVDYLAIDEIVKKILQKKHNAGLGG
jgi:DNA-binding response OmpR family regulator